MMERKRIYVLRRKTRERKGRSGGGESRCQGGAKAVELSGGVALGQVRDSHSLSEEAGRRRGEGRRHSHSGEGICTSWPLFSQQRSKSGRC